MPRVRFKLRRVVIAVAIMGAGIAYARFAIRDYVAWSPMVAVDGEGSAQDADVRRQQIAKIALLAVPPVIVGICLMAYGAASIAPALKRLPRSRFTVRRMMLAVAIVALTCYAARLAFLWCTYTAIAAEFAYVYPFDMPFDPRMTDEERATRRREYERFRDYRAAMARKYERAARYPWLHVAPDPPEPE